jgi:hypothetical protein
VALDTIAELKSHTALEAQPLYSDPNAPAFPTVTPLIADDEPAVGCNTMVGQSPTIHALDWMSRA